MQKDKWFFLSRALNLKNWKTHAAKTVNTYIMSLSFLTANRLSNQDNTDDYNYFQLYFIGRFLVLCPRKTWFPLPLTWFFIFCLALSLTLIYVSRPSFSDSSIHILLFLRFPSIPCSLCIFFAQVEQYFDIPEPETYSVPHIMLRIIPLESI